MNKFYGKLLISLLLCFISTEIFGMEYTIPMNQIQAKIDEKMPFSDDGLVITSIHIIGEDDNSLKAEVVGAYNNLVLHENFDLVGTFSLSYKNQSFYMNNFSIEHAMFNGKVLDLDKHHFAKEKLEEAINAINLNRPIYKMPQDTLKQVMVSKMLDSITVNQNNIVAHYSL